MSPTLEQLQQNYEDFVTAVRASGRVWGLKSEVGWVVCDSEEFEDTDVIPFWAEEAEARQQCCDAWADNEPVAIDLETFLDQWLVEMAEDGTLAGPGWTKELEGLEIEPVELGKRLFPEATAEQEAP